MTQTIFEEIKQVSKYGGEYWSSRDLAKILEYSEYRHFLPVIERAREACKNSGQDIHNHFEDVLDMVQIGSGAEREVQTLKLSRYACYLIVQNSDPNKKIVALGQTYFAIQTRRQEQNDALLEDHKRVVLRDELKKHNTSLQEAADQAGVTNHGKFQNFGYMGLYNGNNASDIHELKGLKKSQKILDHMGSEELAANLFRATQTDAKLRREAIRGENEANLTHYTVGIKVRNTIQELGGTMPEELPATDSVNKAKRRVDKGEGVKEIYSSGE